MTCPLCGRITLPSEQTCLCGFDFALLATDPAATRRMLENKVSTSGMHAAGAFLGSIASLGFMFFMPPLAVIGMVALLIRGGTQLTTRKYAKRALLAHDDKYALPKATVHRL